MYNTLLLFVVIKTLPTLGSGAYHDANGFPCAVGYMDDVHHWLTKTPVCSDDRLITGCVSKAYGQSYEDILALENLNDITMERPRRREIKNHLKKWLRQAQLDTMKQTAAPTPTQLLLRDRVDQLIEELSERQKELALT